MSIGVHAGRLDGRAAAPHGRRVILGPIAGIAALVMVIPLLGWPFLLGQRSTGGYQGWVWLLAAAWWIVLAFASVRVSSTIRASHQAQEHQLEREMGLNRGQLAGTRFQCGLCGSDEYRVTTDHPAAGVTVRCASCDTLYTVTKKELAAAGPPLQ
jgi:predicted Zn finger-like uncharacterized protein